MRIGIDARMTGKGFGIARYTEQLILHLLQMDTVNDYVLFLRQENWDAVPNNTPRIKKVLADIRWYSLHEQLRFTQIIKKEKVDLMHFVHWNIPYFYNDPYVVTIHDLIMFHYPRPEATTLGPLKFWIKDMAHRVLLQKIACKAKHIFATSEFTKKDLHQTLKISFEKITVTYQAPFQKDVNGEIGEGAQNKYNITKPYVLYVGAAYPHKNLQRLMDAWKLFEQKYGSNYQLVLSGKENYFYTELKKYQQKNASTSQIIFTGFVSDEELSALYQHASLYVFPSLYEGFGLPPLEAMVHSVPVISSNRSCLPEVLQNAASYFDPEKIEEIVAALHTGLIDNTVRETLTVQAQSVLKKYSWKKLAEQTLDVYKLLVKTLDT